MLDDVTKRRIDAARDILVGKVPVPSSQVEQITIALIYKFMDDMDKESVSMGGKSSFFSGAYKKYAWSNIFDPRLGGFELINLYGEAIAKLNQNPNIPQLFRDIFKNAYLPYRDPETLKLFLKTINEFSYDHSEDLGDAFEYLLSVLDSQGDAGQFRTPRHIIDFMVAVLDPKKQETIIDPACGTAGFLISSYKHIRKANTGTTKAVQRPGDLLSPSERKKLLTNFKGYDISPDMVRLSLVNLYLHGFVQPQIYEYDTLTSEDRWNEYADVILANPPFMSPKGGIIPHKRFSVQSKRSEVLFVDYIAEHLTPTGRAAVIVPEGIIFQSGGAYKQLRKMLIEKYLYAVVSLPAGVFNPYSGVKTSILLLDRQIASKSDAILFVKIENDGLALGAQRREIDKNDLPDALKVIRKFQKSPRMRTEGSTQGNAGNVLVVAKEKIAENGEYNLTGERYRVVERRGKQKWEMVRLGDVCEFQSGLWKSEKEPLKTIKILRNTNFSKDGRLNLSDIAEHPVEIRQLESRLLKYGDIILEKSGGGPTQPVGRVVIFNINDGEYSYSNFTARIRIKDERIDAFYLWRCLHYLYKEGATENLQKQTSGIRNLDNTAYQNLEIPLPSLEAQRKILMEIEGYQKVIDGARQVVDNWKPHIEVDPEWPMVKLGDVCRIKSGGTPSRDTADYWNGDIPWIKTGQINFNRIFNAEEFITKKGLENSSATMIDGGTILMAMYGQGVTRGKVAILEINAAINQACAAITRKSDDINNDFLFYMLSSKYEYLRQISEARGGNQSNLNAQVIRDITIALPPTEVQREIVTKIEAEQKVVDGCRELMIEYMEKIKRVVDGVWEE
ncbi:hypothetical protein AGMMS49587_13470 [Spirochaetia bacterium]|nr:hypothetical protein AGMMS49587_13470 [Spirochaetia bacterium]